MIKNRDQNEIVYDENEKDYINFDDFITPNHYIGGKKSNEKLRKKNHFKKFSYNNRDVTTKITGEIIIVI